MIDQLYRKAVLTVAGQKTIENAVRARGWGMAQRFVAGETPQTAIQAVHDLKTDGIMANLDLLGEFIESPAQCTQFADNVITMLDAAHADCGFDFVAGDDRAGVGVTDGYLDPEFAEFFFNEPPVFAQCLEVDRRARFGRRLQQAQGRCVVRPVG